MSEAAAYPLDSGCGGGDRQARVTMHQPAVLVIDDEGPYSRVVAEVLQRKGFRVRTAAHGPSGLFAAKRDHPDLILLDIMMPEMDDLAVVRKIRAEPALARTPVVALSALAAAIAPFVSVEMAQNTIEHAASPNE